MKPSVIVVVGASAGGVSSLETLVSTLPASFTGAVLVVMHVPAHRRSTLPEILGRRGPLPAKHPEDGETIRGGQIYVAPPDRHLLVDGQRIVLTNGPRENRYRPSIDALFRSAAYTYESRTIGVVLSGALDDGTSGMWTIKRLGGTTIVQDPNEAQFDSMCASVIEHVAIDHCVRASEIGAILALRAEDPSGIDAADEASGALKRRIEVEVDVAANANAFQKGILDFGEFTPFTCPECHGALVRLKEGTSFRFRCHTGHGYTPSALLAGISEATNDKLWQATRALEEAVMLLDHSAAHFADLGNDDAAKAYASKARETELRAALLQKAALGHMSLSDENVRA